MEKPEPGSAPLERRGGKERAQGGEGHLKEGFGLGRGAQAQCLKTELWKGARQDPPVGEMNQKEDQIFGFRVSLVPSLSANLSVPQFPHL